VTPQPTVARCPHCNTLFRVSAAQLEAAGGRVRCGTCHTLFDIGAPARSIPEDQLDASDIEALLTGDQPAAPNPATAERPRETAPEPTTEQPAASPRPVPAALRADEPAETAEGGLGRTVAWSTTLLLLVAALALQYGYFYRYPLAQEPVLRPWLESLCRVAACDLPLRREPEQITMERRAMRSHPAYRNALEVTATLVNNAPFPQPYPQVELVMRNLATKILAARRFQPDEYLSPPARGTFAPGEKVELRLDLVDPGPGAVSFEFRLL